MILVTLGTQKQPFTRLLEKIEKSNITEEIIVQNGYTNFTSKKMKLLSFISYSEMEKLINEARLIITHSGTGSVIMPLMKGKKVIVCTRLQKYGEHVDDHQKQLTDVFKDKGYILELGESDDLDELLEQVETFKPNKFISNKDEFIKQLKNEIE